MYTQTQRIRDILRVTVLSLALAAFNYGCGDDASKSTGNDQDPIDYSPNIDDDIATFMAAVLAADNGGAADQLVDVASLSLGEGLRATNLVTADEGETEQLIYNSGNGTWHWRFAREYSGANGLYFAHINRTYEWRFLKKNGQPQVSYVHNGDTAYSVELDIISGTGRHELPLLTQRLTSLSGKLVATGTNTDAVTINGWWTRSGLDTIRTRAAVRSVRHQCSLSVADMHCELDSVSMLWEKLSGEIVGTLSATIEFLEGDAYDENTESRDIAIAIDTGVAAITVRDSTWNCELRHGTMLLPPDPDE